MKRNEKYNVDEISVVYPIFSWKKCIVCKMEFRMEKGYAKITGPFFNGMGRRSYICGTCAKSKLEAKHLF